MPARRPRKTVFAVASVIMCLTLWTASASVVPQQPPAQAEARAPEVESGISLYRRGDMKGAAKALKAALKKKKDDADALYYLGLVQTVQGKMKDALKSFESALRLRPNMAGARAGLAYLALLADKWREAEAEAERALALDPQFIDAHFVIGQLRLREEAWVKVMERADAMLKLDPQAAQAYYLKSRASLGLYFRANAILTEERRGAYAYNGETLRQAREAQPVLLKQAAASLKEFLRLRPSDPDASELRQELETLLAYAQAAEQSDPSFKIYTGSQVTTKAVLLKKPEPGFSEAARSAGITGTVKLRMVLAADGQVRHILVMRSLSHGLTERAIAAARRIKFKPATVNGLPVSQYVIVEYNFNIY